jgi:hypothetical protein
VGQQCTNRKIMVKAGLGIKRDPISKIIKAQRPGIGAQVTEHLLDKHKASSSNLVLAKKILPGSKALDISWIGT